MNQNKFKVKMQLIEKCPSPDGRENPELFSEDLE
jgi:hypothetical protein